MNVLNVTPLSCRIQRFLQRGRLRSRIGQQRRAAAHFGIGCARHRSAPRGNEFRQQPAQRLRHANNRGVAKEIKQERLDGVLICGTAEIEQE